MTSVRVLRLAAALGIAVLCGPVVAGADARVAVHFLSPERYTDANNRSGSGPSLRGTLSEIRYLLEAAALRVMAPGDRLRVDVLDIDLAGFAHPGFAPPSSPRLVSDVTPPVFHLRYELRRDGRRIASGEERVTDLNFLFGARATRSGTFAYEDELLRDWARRRLTTR